MRHAAARIAAHLPAHVQCSLKRHYYRWQIRTNRFLTDEPEFQLLPAWVELGDWVLDIGANVGHYTARLSKLVGPEGRVFAFEPVPATFELLSANASAFACRNVTLLNLAASDRSGPVSMEVPLSEDAGLQNYYMAHLTHNSVNGIRTYALPVDSLDLSQPISLVKVDAEGHDMAVLAGMVRTLNRFHPVVIVEDHSDEMARFMAALSYGAHTIPGSPNRIFIHSSTPEKRSAVVSAVHNER